MSQHPFAMQLGELEEVLKSSSAANREPAQATEEEEGCGCGSPTEEDATTERLGEEGGTKPDVTTMAVGEEGGMEPRELPPPPDFPDATGIVAEQGGFIPDPLPVAVTQAVEETGNMEPRELPPPPDFPDVTEVVEEQGGFISDPLPVATTPPVREEEQESPPPDFPQLTDILAEQGGVVSDPLVTTEAVGEEGGSFTEVLGEQGEGVATTMAIGEEGGIVTRADGEDGDVVFTFIEGEDGEIRDLDEPEATTLAVGEEGGDFDVPIAEVGTFGGTPDDGNFDVTTLALGEEGGFNEVAYGELYPPLIDAVNSGVIPSLADHYNNFGQFEPERIGIFSGTPGRDVVVPFGNNTVITGVPVFGYDPIVGDFVFGGNGSGEVDVLAGESNASSTETFVLGNSQSQPFYVGFGDADFALIQNFDVGSDQIQLSGAVTDYNFTVFDNSTNISTAAGDLVAIVENVPNIQDATLIFEG